MTFTDFSVRSDTRVITRYAALRLALILSTALALTACGYKGDLTHPVAQTDLLDTRARTA